MKQSQNLIYSTIKMSMCPACSGKGKIHDLIYRKCDHGPTRRRLESDGPGLHCHRCNGTGRILETISCICSNCHGTGKIQY